MRLSDGAEAIRGDLPASSTHVVDVPMEAGDELGSGLPRLGSLQLVRDRVREALESIEGWPLLIGGDCGAELAAVERVAADGTVAVVWFDAHPDLNTPETSTTGAFGGMVLRTLLGDGVEALVPAIPLAPGRVVVAGSRSTDDSEEQYLLASGIARVGVDALATPDALLSAIEETGAASVYLHIDLDVLDPAELAGLSDPVPFGVTAAALVQTVKAVRARYPLVGAGITGFSPATEAAAADDLPTILRIIGALTSP